MKIKQIDNKSAVKFTADQSKAIDGIIEWLKEPFDSRRLSIALVGAAGTGKSFSIKHIIENSGYSSSVVGLSAPTHKAVRVLREATGLNVNTIQSDLGLRLDFNVENFDVKKPPFNPLSDKKIEGYKVYIVDEASMINRGLKEFIEAECIKYQIKLIFCGDAYQLPPVGEVYSPCFRGITTFELKEIVRQGDDNPNSAILELLRSDVKNKTFRTLAYITNNNSKFNSDLTKGFSVTNMSNFIPLVKDAFTSSELENDVDACRIIAYTNSAVSGWNKAIRHFIVPDNAESILTKQDLITSYVSIVNNFNEAIIRNSEDYIVYDIQDYVNRDGLVGFNVKFQAIYGGTITPPMFIINHADKFTLAKYYTTVMKLMETAKTASTPAARSGGWRKYYEYKNNNLLLTNINDSNNKLLIGRDLDYGYSLTANKSQGSTFTDVFVDVNNIVFNERGMTWGNAEEINRRLYVAISRCKNKAFLLYGK